jgi:group II intron reverse transcriptase/maturase
MSAAKAPPGKAMYVASQADWAWLRSEQQKLHARSMNQPDYVFAKLWGLVTDPRNLRIALSRVARNHGRHTAGVDRVTVRVALARGGDAFAEETRTQLRAGTYRPSPVRRVLIPKAGQPGKFRALGIPTVQDRVVQAALKNILEPIYEADFFPISYGFRPGRSVHAAIEHLRMLLRPRPTGPTQERRLPYQYAVEGDIKACFDNIDHHALMERIRRRVNDTKVARLVRAFLRAGVMEDLKYLRSDRGTPQGGIFTPPTQLTNFAGARVSRGWRCGSGHRIGESGERGPSQSVSGQMFSTTSSWRRWSAGHSPSESASSRLD